MSLLYFHLLAELHGTPVRGYALPVPALCPQRAPVLVLPHVGAALHHADRVHPVALEGDAAGQAAGGRGAIAVLTLENVLRYV